MVLGQKKLNAVYGFKDGGGNEGVRQAVEEILGIDIPYVIAVDYDAVKAVVDLVDGVEVDVPFAMNYDDPYADPPLHIHLDAGVQTLTGDDAIGFIRFRKSNDGRISDGDVGRIERPEEVSDCCSRKNIDMASAFCRFQSAAIRRCELAPFKGGPSVNICPSACHRRISTSTHYRRSQWAEEAMASTISSMIRKIPKC